MLEDELSKGRRGGNLRDSQHVLVSLLEGIYTLLELKVIGWELCLWSLLATFFASCYVVLHSTLRLAKHPTIRP